MTVQSAQQKVKRDITDAAVKALEAAPMTVESAQQKVNGDIPGAAVKALEAAPASLEEAKQKGKRTILGVVVTVLMAIQFLLILAAGVFGTMVNFRYLRPAENYIPRLPCEDRNYECVPFDTRAEYVDGDTNSTVYDVTPYLSNGSFVCRAKGGGGVSEIFRDKTCAVPLAPCQLWNLSNYDRVGIDFDPGLGDFNEIGVEVDSGLSRDVDVDTGEAGIYETSEDSDRCGLTEDGHVDTSVVYKDETNEYKPSIPRPLVWMVYRHQHPDHPQHYDNDDGVPVRRE